MKIRIIKESKKMNEEEEYGSLKPGTKGGGESDIGSFPSLKRTGRDAYYGPGTGIEPIKQLAGLSRGSVNSLSLLKREFITSMGTFNDDKEFSLSSLKQKGIMNKLEPLINELEEFGYDVNLTDLLATGDEFELGTAAEAVLRAVGYITKEGGRTSSERASAPWRYVEGQRRKRPLGESTMKIRVIKEARASDLIRKVTDTDPSSEAGATEVDPQSDRWEPATMAQVQNKLVELEGLVSSVESLVDDNQVREALAKLSDLFVRHNPDTELSGSTEAEAEAEAAKEAEKKARRQRIRARQAKRAEERKRRARTTDAPKQDGHAFEQE